MRAREQLYIGGKWVASSGRGSIEVIDAATEEPIGSVPRGDEEDVDRAVQAAARAFESWSATPVAERARWLERLKEGLAARAEEIATTVCGEVGSPIAMARTVQAGLPVSVTGSFPAIAREFPFEERIGNSMVVREAVGVVAAITPWNYPLHQAMGKVAPALAAGCTVVLKPSEVAPLTAFILADVVHEAGLPPGVFNLVTGLGPPFGEALVRHPRVDMISLTGSTAAGRRVAELAAGTIKRVALELGGKSASVILDDADFDKAVGVSVSNAFLNAGQTCSAWTRMLVPRKRQEQALEIAKRAAAKFKPGDPRAPETRLGPLASAQQRERVRSVGVLPPFAAHNTEGQNRVTAFAQALQQLGWSVGQNARLHYRWGDGTSATMQKYAAELVALAPDVILADSSAALSPLLQATQTIPIVFAIVADPVGAGYVETLARPGGNATGFTPFEYGVAGKWLELLKEIAPRVTRAAVLRDPAIAAGPGQFGALQAVAPSLGVELRAVNVRDADEIERSIAGFAQGSNGGLVVTGSAAAAAHRDLIVTLAARHRLPAIYNARLYGEIGGLVCYGADFLDQFRRAAGYADRILKGEKPADLPVQAPTKYELVINLKTAKALGLDVPPSLLARADEVIE